MVVYADLIFLFNLLLDAFLLWATARTRLLKPKGWRIALASGLGASYVVLMFVPMLSFLFTFIAKMVMSVLMLLIAFGYGGAKRFWRNLGAFYCINFAAAGGILGAHYLLQQSSEVMNGIIITQTGLSFEIRELGALFIIVFLMISVVLYRVVFSGKRRQDNVAQHLAEVTVTMEEHEFVCTGLIDTGNHLYDPLTRTPVMIMEAAAWADFLPAGWIKRIQNAELDEIINAIGKDEFRYQDRLRLVPYRGVNSGTQFMLALKPDKVVIRTDKHVTEAVKVLIGLDGGQLSSDGAYKAIIHPALMEPVAL
ncbi:peptidase [Paenibacillus swuensis]|uniref:Sporulation sigma-E factor-processing peptidase n=1 Tax=Paenibacillus swuensis TaxID=1178515 RepID=A0A172TPG9_9BACL|nr:sigma-E processing peptidase SpoIIGA [Paenibacillus swuensis]ANE48945.1 peptidase [Paenibacillus swuensis]